MRARIRLAMLVLASLGGCCGQDRLSVEDAVAEALASHSLLAAAGLRIEAAGGLLRQAGFSPNPTFLFQQESIRATRRASFQYWEDTDTFALLQRRFETGDKRENRVTAARQDVERAKLEQALLALQIAGRVKTSYWEAAGAQRVHDLLTGTARNFAQIVLYHEAQVKEGAMAEADLLRVLLEEQRLALTAHEAGLEAAQARIRLFREMGRSDIPAAVSFDVLKGARAPAVVADRERALADRPETRLARLAVGRAQAELELQRSQAWPDIEGTVGYKRTAGYNTLVGGVQIDLPIGNRNQGNIAAAGASIQAARRELRAAEAAVLAEVTAALENVSSRGRQITDSIEPMMDRAMEASKIAEGAYREGGWDLLRLLDAERLRIETETLYYRALASYRQSLAALESAMGVMP